MKKLICEQDIKALAERGETCCELSGPVIITPSARDAAEAAGITFRAAGPSGERPAHPDQEENRITPELVLRVLQGLAAQGRLPSALCGKLTDPYFQEEEDGGLLLLRNARADELLPGTPGVRRRELFQGQGAGTWILEIDRGVYPWAPEEDEKEYVLEGSLSVSAGRRRYSLQTGDCLFIPRGVSVELEAVGGRCRVLCAACRPPRAAGAKTGRPIH